MRKHFDWDSKSLIFFGVLSLLCHTMELRISNKKFILPDLLTL